MVARPSYTSNRSKVTITIPPEWFCTVSAVSSTTLLLCSTHCSSSPQISRQPYKQFMYVKPDVRGLVGNFGSTVGSSNDTMKNAPSNALTFPVKQQNKVVKLDFSFYYSLDPTIKDAVLKTDAHASSNAQVVKVILTSHLLSNSN